MENNTVDYLKTLDDAYFNSEPLVSDAEYDSIKYMVSKRPHMMRILMLLVLTLEAVKSYCLIKWVVWTKPITIVI